MTVVAATDIAGWPFWALPLACFAVVWAVTLVLRRRERRRAVRSDGPTPRQVARGATVVGGISVVAGLALFVAFTARPVYRAFRADAWPTTDGVVVRSALERSHGSKGTTYRIDIHYRYAVAGQTYESNQYDGSGTHLRTSVGYDAMRAAVDARPAGTPVVVHYDPRDPADAMLSTRVPAHTLTLGWVPLVFVVFGGIVVVCVPRAARQGEATAGPSAERPA